MSFKRDWFSGGLLGRLPLVGFLLTFQALYFPINWFLADKGGFVADIEAIDGNMPLLPIFVIPYVSSLLMLPLFVTVAAWKFPRELFQEYMIAFFTIMVFGFCIWLLFPAYVVKEPIEGSGFFLDMVKQLHGNDSNYGTHNAIPSSHVYYVTLPMMYYLRYNPKLAIPFMIYAVVNALSTMFTHQHYLLDVVAGWAMVPLAYALSRYMLTPFVQRWEAQSDLVRVSDEAVPQS